MGAGSPRERRFAYWLDVVGDLIALPVAELPIDLLLRELRDTFGTMAAWHWLDADGSLGFLLSDAVPGWPAAAEMEEWGRSTMGLHPLMRWFATTQDPTAMSLGRVPVAVGGAEGFRQVREQLTPVGLEQQLGMPYEGSRTFVLSTSGRDFTDEDLALARRLQPLLALLARQVRVLGDGTSGGTAAAARTGATSPATTPDPLGLTGREAAVLRLLADGGTATSIGRQLGISPRTVHVHLGNLYRKLGVNDRLLAVRIARDAGVLPEPGGPPARIGSPRTAGGGIADLHTDDGPTACAARAFSWHPGAGLEHVLPAS